MYDPEGPSYGGGKYYLKALHVALIDNKFVIYDKRGFLCTCDSPDELLTLLEAEATPHGGNERPHYWPQARNVVFPGYAEEQERKAIELRSAVPINQIRAKAPTLTLKDLGL